MQNMHTRRATGYFARGNSPLKYFLLFSAEPTRAFFQKDAGTSADALVLRVVGLIKTRSITKSTGLYATVSGAAAYTDHQAMSEDMEFLGYDVHLASFGGKMAAGEHSFPFSVVLPSELPPSMKVPIHGSTITSLPWRSQHPPASPPVSCTPLLINRRRFRARASSVCSAARVICLPVTFSRT